MVKKKSWVEKLHDSKDLPKIVKMGPKARERWGGETLYVPAPVEVDAIMRLVPEGKVITTGEIREKLARKHKTDVACSLTSGIFCWIAAWAAEEEKEAGKKGITAYWKTLKSGGELNPKYPGGEEGQKKLLEEEGHRVVAKGRKWVVESWEMAVARV